MGSAARTSVAVLLLCLTLASCEDRRSPVDQAANWWPPSQRANARCIIFHESTNRPDAVSPGGANLGLLQINRVHAAAFKRLTGKPIDPGAFDPRLAGQFGFVLWSEQGWRPWATRHVCGLG